MKRSKAPNHGVHAVDRLAWYPKLRNGLPSNCGMIVIGSWFEGRVVGMGLRVQVANSPILIAKYLYYNY